MKAIKFDDNKVMEIANEVIEFAKSMEGDNSKFHLVDGKIIYSWMHKDAKVRKMVYKMNLAVAIITAKHYSLELKNFEMTGKNGKYTTFGFEEVEGLLDLLNAVSNKQYELTKASIEASKSQQ